MSIVNYASPEYRFYDTDKKIMEDYDNRIGIYNTALGEYNTQAGDYQKLVDDFNTNQIEPWNAKLAQWQQDRETYNAAIEKWNATDRTTPYESWSGTVTSPGNFESTAPVFEGGAAPVAPDDPGFAGSDVDAFIEESQPAHNVVGLPMLRHKLLLETRRALLEVVLESSWFGTGQALPGSKLEILI